MSPLTFRMTLCVIVYIVYTSLNRAEGASSITPLCGAIDYKPDNRHYARSMTANLNVGEPRTVRLIYFLPNDREYRDDIVQRMKHEILNLQTFYAESMQAHGYDMTFNIETDAQDELVVHRLDGQHSEIHYVDNASKTVRDEIEQVFDVRQNIYFIVFDSSTRGITTGVGRGRVNANGGNRGKTGGTTLIDANYFQNNIKRDKGRTLKGRLKYDKLSAHEIGHAFGLEHDFRSGAYIMSYGTGRGRAIRDATDRDRLSSCNANCLSVHPYFNPNIPTESGDPPTIELTSHDTYPAGSHSIDIQLKITDSDGLHQAILFVKTPEGPLSPGGYPEVKAYRKLIYEKEADVNFEYDGDIPSTIFTRLSMYPTHRIYITAIDVNGDIFKTRFTFSEDPSKQVEYNTPLKISEGTQEIRVDNSYQKLGLPTGARFRIGKGGIRPFSDRTVAFSPDGQYLAVASTVGVWLYDTVNYQEYALMPSQYAITYLAFSPDGSAIVGASSSGNQVWSIITKERIATFRNGGYVVAFSPNGDTIATDGGRKIIIWDVKTERKVIEIDTNNSRGVGIDTISYSHDGALIAGAGRDGLIKLWDVVTGQNIHTFSHESGVQSIAFSPTENILASGSSDATVKLWDAATGAEILAIETLGTVMAVTFSPDGNILAWSDGISDTVNLWDVATQSIVEIHEPDTVFRVDSIALSPDNSTFVTVNPYETVKVRDIATGNTIDLGHKEYRPISFSPDSAMLASGGRREVTLWDVNTGESVANIPVESLAWFVSFLNSNTLAYREWREDFIRLWDVTTQTQVGTIETQYINQHDANLVFSPDKKTLALTAGRTIELWDIATGQNTDTLEGHVAEISSLAYSPDGNILVSTSWDDTVRLWDLTTEQSTVIFEGDSRSDAAFSHDGTILAFSISNVGVILWNMITPGITIIEEDEFLTFLPDSSMMLLRNLIWHDNEGHRESFSIWDAKTATHIATLDSEMFEGWKQPIFLPDGNTLAIIGQDSTVLFDSKVLYDQLPPSAPANVKIANAIQTSLLSNYPNPFNPETWIPFRLAEDATVTLTIYDVDGRVVRGLDIGHQRAGVYETRNKAIYWDGRNDLGERVASGVYFYHLTAKDFLRSPDYSATKRMVILK